MVQEKWVKGRIDCQVMASEKFWEIQVLWLGNVWRRWGGGGRIGNLDRKCKTLNNNHFSLYSFFAYYFYTFFKGMFSFIVSSIASNLDNNESDIFILYEPYQEP